REGPSRLVHGHKVAAVARQRRGAGRVGWSRPTVHVEGYDLVPVPGRGREPVRVHIRGHVTAGRLHPIEVDAVRGHVHGEAVFLHVGRIRVIGPGKPDTVGVHGFRRQIAGSPRRSRRAGGRIGRGRGGGARRIAGTDPVVVSSR